MRALRYGFLGRLGYREAVRLQEDVRAGLRAGGPEHLLLLEHEHVYTLGRSADRADIRAGAPWLAARGVAVEESDRGGQVTYHGPGQLVGYPILNLDPDRRDVRRYVLDLQEVLVRTLAGLGVAAEGRGEQAEIGVWVGDEKIASIGVHLSRWLTTHGFALNLTTDLSYFAGIVACGLEGVRMTSVERLTGRRIEPAEVADRCAGHFAAVFGRRLEALGPRGRRPERPSRAARLPMPWEPLDHTADAGVLVTAGDREALFAEALRALTDCITDVDRVRPRRRRRGRGRRRRPRAAAGRVARRGSVSLRRARASWRPRRGWTIVDQGDRGPRLTGEIRGEPHDPRRHPHRVAVKAITYHGLEVARTAAGWQARVIFDI